MKQKTIRLSGNRQYHLFNGLIFILIAIGLVCLKLNLFTVQCVYAKVGITCKTCGITRAFRAILNGEISRVSNLQLYVFILLGGQLIIRPLVSYLLFFTKKHKAIMKADIFITAFMLIFYIIFMIT